MEYFGNYAFCKSYGDTYNRYTKSLEYTRFLQNHFSKSFVIALGKKIVHHNIRRAAYTFGYKEDYTRITIEEYYLFGENYKNHPRFIKYVNGVRTYEIIDTDYDTIYNDYAT